jgi:hypothetical protein
LAPGLRSQYDHATFFSSTFDAQYYLSASKVGLKTAARESVPAVNVVTLERMNAANLDNLTQLGLFRLLDCATPSDAETVTPSGVVGQTKPVDRKWTFQNFLDTE